jgi:UDP-N-acetylglucosamine 2-epimerase (non-hydrolysing)
LRPWGLILGDRGAIATFLGSLSNHKSVILILELTMKTVMFVFGTRPEAIKLAPIILRMRESQDLKTHVCVTAQHREMLDQVLEVFGVAPDSDLDLMEPNQTLAGFASKAVGTLNAFLEKSRPDLVIAQGDTTTVFVAGLCAFYHRIPVGHVEAGLRTENKYSPFPEEMNRRLATRLTDIHFAPTEWTKQNLLAEGIPEQAIHVTGNSVIDALVIASEKVQKRHPRIPGLSIDPFSIPDRKMVLITGHRRESFGRGFESLCTAITELAEMFPDYRFVYPVHLNPNVREPVYRVLSDRTNVHLIEPVAYLEFVSLMMQSKIILTDSGGVQEEAPTLGKPILVMRENTERPEAVKAGCARLVGTDKNKIVSEVRKLLTDTKAYDAMSRVANPYGDGKTSDRISRIVHRYLNPQGS